MMVRATFALLFMLWSYSLQALTNRNARQYTYLTMEIITWVIIAVVGIIALIVIVKFIKGCLLKLVLVGFLIALAAFVAYALLFWR
ncbi:hypothetical protein ACFLYR_07855 [Chloroflexota bacterium]